VDLDGDGIPDVLSGSWPGELHFFKGLGKGKYAAASPIKDSAGKAINLGSASTVFAADWRGSGKLDLVVGCVEGHVWLVPNEGSRDKPAYGKAVKLSAGGKEIKAEHGDSHPTVADWEGTGKPGLVVGCGDGSVLWFRNEGSAKEPKLGKAFVLVPPAKQMYPDPTKKAPSGPQRGTRAKVWVGDFDGDGRLDLLVGDFSYSYGEEPKLSDADRKRQQELSEKQTRLQKDLEPYQREVSKLYEKGDTKTPEGRAALNKGYQKIADKHKKALQEQSALYAEMRKFQRPMHYHGYVWLYQGKASATSASR
jgi:hypothetical protein